MRLPLINEVMTIAPITIQEHQNLEEAKQIMYKKGIRHLPVLNGQKIVGILSDRDLKLTLAVAGKDRKPTEITIGECCARDPYIVEPKEELKIVLKEMTRRRLGSALVGTDDELFGIFTVTDAVKCFGEFLEQLE
jgi:acetoin utilization protein AcuB